MMEEVFVQYLNKICESEGFVRNYEKIRDNLGLSLDEVKKFRLFLLEHEIITEEKIDCGLCEECSENANVIDFEKGILKCSRGHQTVVDPIFLLDITIKPSSIASFLRKKLNLKKSSFNKDVYSHLGIEFISSITESDIPINFILSLKHMSIKEFYAISGSELTNEGMNIVFYNNESFSKEIISYLNLISCIKVVSFSDALNDYEKILKNISTETKEKIKVQNWLKQKYLGYHSQKLKKEKVVKR